MEYDLTLGRNCGSLAFIIQYAIQSMLLIHCPTILYSLLGEDNRKPADLQTWQPLPQY